jgi:hypothetical protein
MHFDFFSNLKQSWLKMAFQALVDQDSHT